MGPIAFATPPVLKLSLTELVRPREAVLVPSVKAMLFDTNPLREEVEGIGLELDEDIYKLVDA